MVNPRLISVLGLVVMLLIATLFSKRRSAIAWNVVGWGIGLQFLFGLIILKTSFGAGFFSGVNKLILNLLSYQQEGGKLVFNALAIPPDQPGSLGFFFAFQVLTTIIFFSALISLLYYFGIMQFVVVGFARVMHWCMGTSGAETLSASANIFIGQTEAPLLVKPYVKDMTDSELLAVMVGGMATVAGGVMGAYVGLLKDFFPDIAGHLLAASLMSAPAGIAIAKILLPEEGHPKTAGMIHAINDDSNSNAFEATANGASTGMSLALNVATMLIAFMSLLALFNAILGWAGGLVGFEGLSLQAILGYICAPLAWLMGAPWEECLLVGQLIGEKTAINELVAYFHFAEILRDTPEMLSERSRVIATYALTGFSNLMSIGILIGGIGAIAPSRRADLARLGLLALLGGSLACFLTATVAGILL